jgi:ADP-heptose:LPS heptosyltransferase
MSKTALLSRLGGLGDCIIIPAVAKQLKLRGYEVDFCAGSPTCDVKKLLEGTNIFRNVILQTKMFNGLDVYDVGNGDVAGLELLKEEYDLVVDYKMSVELNSHWRHMANGAGKEWMVSQNSNYVNWVDIMLAWAGIDPETVSDEDKLPIYVPSEEEMKWARTLLRASKPDKVVAVQMNASSLVRTWYHPQTLPNLIREKYPNKKIDILFYDGATWRHIKGKYDVPVQFPKDFDPIRASAALVAASDLFIGADSGFSHISEAVKVPHITIYTTVPAWTRDKYYRFNHHIEPIGHTFDGVRCRPCFVLDRYCPRTREAALRQLTPRELKIKEGAEKNIPPQILAQELGTTPTGLINEHKFMQERLNALLEMQSPCSMTITSDRILKKVEEIFGV